MLEEERNAIKEKHALKAADTREMSRTFLQASTQEEDQNRG